MKLSQRIKSLTPSATLAASAKAKALKEQGRDILSLTVGEPDFTTPKNIQDAAIAAIESGKASFYTVTPGLPKLREAVVSYMKDNYDLAYQTNQIIVTDGAKFALYALFQTILDDQDEVIIPVPYWVSYSEQVKLASGQPVFVEGSAASDFKVTVEQLEAVRTTKTKAIILNTPSNPTGMIYSKEELSLIGNWAVTHNILIVADDIYGRLVYNGNTFTPIATISEAIRKQTIIINGVSKSYAMTGWRIGFAVGDAEIIKGMIDIASQTISNPTAVSQYAAIEALTGDQTTVESMRQAFEERLNTVYPLLAEIPGIEVLKPQGAFYLFPNVKETASLCGYSTITKWLDDLLEEQGVALIDGTGFGAPEYVRISYANDLATLIEAVERIQAFVKSKMKK